jgi:predicted dehydrogenase
MKKLHWGILGTGMIARRLAAAIPASATGSLVAVGSRSQATADKFGDEFKVPHRHGSYEALLADRDVEAVYISLPNHLHAEWTVRCAEAGKHILCEKPFTVNHAEAMAVIEAVREHDVFLMEAFMYRCHPQTARLVELLRSGVIGEVRVIQAHFSYNLGQKLDNIRLQNAAAGGAIMDIGCYCLSLARLIAGGEPTEIKGTAYIGAASRVDEYATAVLKFPGPILANLTCGNQVNTDSTLRVWGSNGHILVPHPWFPGPDADSARIIVNRDGEASETISVPGGSGLYSIEVDTVARHLKERQAPAPCMTWDDTIQNMRALDLWRREVGLVFDAEKLTAPVPTLTGRPLRARPKHGMKYGRVVGVTKPVARLVLGTMLEGATDRTSHAMRLFDCNYSGGIPPRDAT